LFANLCFGTDNSDLIACTVASKDGSKIRRFLVMDVIQLILVEPDTRRLGWGVAKFVGFLQVCPYLCSFSVYKLTIHQY